MKHVIGIALLITLSGCTTWGVYPTPYAPRDAAVKAPAVVYTPITPQPKAQLHVATSKRIALHAAVILGQVGDAISTQQQIRNGAVELNPVLKQLVQHPVYAFSLKTLVAAFNIYEGEKMYRQGNPSWWKGEAAVIAIGWGAFGWNERQVFIHDRSERRKVGIAP
jgi:hypothetical protein